MEPENYISLTRACEVTQIPSGYKMKLPQGAKVRITQSLGGSYTVITQEGYMARIAPEDLDAIGKEAAKDTAAASTEPPTKESVEKNVWNQMRTCYDPEIPVNIVELGLVYGCEITPLSENEFKVHVKMTLTAPGCGMGASISGDAQSKIRKIPGVKEAQVELVWIPPWDPTKMSEAAKLQLGMM